MQKVNTPYRVIISGGGTGGHIYPAIAIANALKAIDSDIEILFVGAKGRMEMQKIPEAGYQIEGLWISGIQRRLTLDNLAFPLKLISSVRKSFSILADFKPNAVVGVGGYASGPLLYAASAKGIPAMLQEQNSHPGITNKMLAGKVRKICVAQDGMEKFFPKEKLVVTGNPIRQDIVKATQENLDSKREEAFSYFGLSPKKKTILSVGGSLGARTINDSIIKDISKLTDQDVQIIWQSGKIYYQEMKGKLEAIPQCQGIKLVEFLNRMDLAYAAADIVISRAGALAISELCLVKKPVVFVPSPNVAEDHQRKNAEALVARDAAIMILDKDAREQMIDTALALLQHTGRQQELKENIGKLAKPHAAEAIAREVIGLFSSDKNIVN